MASTSVINTRPRMQWWTAEKGSDEVHTGSTGAFKYLDREQDYHRQRDLHHLRLYSNRLAAAMSGRAFAEFYPWDESGLRYNVVQAIVDAACAQISTNRPRAMPTTTDADYKIEKRAKKMGQFTDGMFENLDQYTLLSQQVFLFCAIFGTSHEKVYTLDDNVAVEVIMRDEIVVDDVEAARGKPRTLYQYKEADPEVVAAEFGLDAGDLRGAALLRDDHLGRHNLYQPISVIESWRLPSKKGGKDGRHVICTSNKTLLDERWDRMHFPFATMHWKLPVYGYNGIGLAEELTPLQIEMNFVTEMGSELLWFSGPETWVQKGSVSDSAWTNQRNRLREFSGTTPPVRLNGSAFPPELMAWINDIFNRGYALSGVSQMQAASQKPAGLNSGEAIKNYNDITSARFLHVGQRWEKFHMDLAKLMTEEARDITKRLKEKGQPGLTILAKSKVGLEELNFADVDLDRDKFVLQVMPTAYLPTTPAGKLDAIERFGQIDPTIGRYLLDELNFPDLERAVSVANAPVEIIDMCLEAIIDRGEYIAPEPVWGPDTLNNGIIRATLFYMKYQTKKLEAEKQTMLRDWIVACTKLMQPAQPPQQPGPTPAQAAQSQQPQPGAAATPPQQM